MMKAYRALLKTELKLSLRGMDMTIFALIMPLVVLVLIGVVYGEQAAFAGAQFTFLEQSFGALATIAICAGGVMGLPLVISDYRSKGILKRMKVTPVSPALLLVVQVTVYTIYAVLSLLLLYGAASIGFGFSLRGSWLHFAGGYVLVLVSIFSIGMAIGGLAPNTKAAGATASLLYFPMLIFSGATLPYEVLPVSLQRIADFMPLTQGIKLLKAAALGLPADGVLVPLAAMLAVGLLCVAVSVKFFKWE